MIAGPRSADQVRGRPRRRARRTPSASSERPRSVIRPFTIAWLARGDGDRVDALPDVVDLVDDVRPGVEEHRRRAAPARNGTQFEAARRPTASAAPARTGMTDAVKANGRRISQSAPARRRRREPRRRAAGRRPGSTAPRAGASPRPRRRPRRPRDPARPLDRPAVAGAGSPPRRAPPRRSARRSGGPPGAPAGGAAGRGPASAWKAIAPAATSSRVPHSMNASSSSSGMRLPAVV